MKDVNYRKPVLTSAVVLSLCFAGESWAAGREIPVADGSANSTPTTYYGGDVPVATGGPLEFYDGSTSHPDRIEVQVGRLGETRGQPGIRTHSWFAYGSLQKDMVLNLTTGVLTLLQLYPMDRDSYSVDLTPPANGGNYFTYTAALGEMRTLIQRVRAGNNFMPLSSPAHPDLDATLNYLDFITASLLKSPVESLYTDRPAQVRPAGKYAIAVSYKTDEPRDIVVDFSCNSLGVAAARDSVPAGLGSRTVNLALPAALPAECGPTGQVNVRLVPQNASAADGALAIYSNQVVISPTNVIETVYTRGGTELRDKGYWFQVHYALATPGVLHIALVEKNAPSEILLQSEVPVEAGDQLKQDVLLMLPDQLKSRITGREQILLKITAKDGTTLATYMIYAANARA